MSKIIDVNSLQQYKDDMVAYGIFVNRRRMVPNLKDGLKTIHRRVVYAAYYSERAIDKNVKSAAIVGSTMKSFHPHGDSSIYDAMKPLTNWFEIYIPLFQGKGNWGSFQGDSQAAPRYTETRVSKFAMECVIGELKDNKQVVDWVENYDGTDMEPEYFPVSVPLLLINGAFGIGFGLKTEIPKHNTNEVIDATLKLIANPNSEVMLVPDQCMPCDIIEANFKSICNKGNGKFRVRGIIDIEEYCGKPALVIKSTPDMVFLNTVTESIDKMISEKKIVQIVETVEDSSGNDMRFIIVLKKGTDANFVRDVIYKNTLMENSFSVNFEVLDGIEPIRMSYKSYLLSFIEFRKVTKFRLYCNKLQAVQTKLHEREIYIKVLQSGYIDEIINMIRHQTTVDDTYLIEFLVSKLNITDLQSKFIINTDLRKLSVGYLNRYLIEAEELSVLKTEYLNKITNDDIILQEIVDELKYYKKKYGKPRNCKVISQSEISDIPKGEFKVVISDNNFIKKVAINDPIGTFRGDAPKIVVKGDNTESLIIFDEKGKVFKLPIHKIPFTDRNSNGTDIRTIIKHLTSNINKVLYEPTLKDLASRTKKYFITVVTRDGNIKKLDIEDFLAVPPSGILYIKLDQTDSVKEVRAIREDSSIIVYSKNKALRMWLEDVPHQKRNTKGMKAISEDTVDGLAVIEHNTTDIVVITEDGKVNRFDQVALPSLGRNKSGSKVIKLSKGDSIKFICGVNFKDTIKVTTKANKYDLVVSELQPGSSVSGGNKVMSTKNDNIIRCDILRYKK